MELTHDWKGFQRLFYPQRRVIAKSGGQAMPRTPDVAVHAIVDRDTVVVAYCEGEDMLDWTGASFAELSEAFCDRDVYGYARDEIDKWIGDSMGSSQSFDQAEQLRAIAMPKLVSKRGKKAAGQAPKLEKHFVLDALQTWWGKILPSSYGLYLRLEGAGGDERDFFVLVRRGAFETFHEPDLAFLNSSGDRSRSPADVVKFLSEKYLVPVQGFFVPSDEWASWNASADPWKQVAVSLKAKRAKLVPLRFGIASLIATRAFLRA